MFSRFADDAAGDFWEVAHQPFRKQREGRAAGHQRRIRRELVNEADCHREGDDQRSGAVAQRVEVAQRDADHVRLGFRDFGFQLRVGVAGHVHVENRYVVAAAAL